MYIKESIFLLIKMMRNSETRFTGGVSSLNEKELIELFENIKSVYLSDYMANSHGNFG